MILSIALAAALLIISWPINRFLKRKVDMWIEQTNEQHQQALQHYNAAFEDWKRTQAVARATMVDEHIDRSMKRRKQKFVMQSGKRHRMAPSTVYLFGADQMYYKIGFATDVRDRLKEIRTSCPLDVILVHTIFTEHAPRLEALLHRRYDHCRVRGEWFKLRPDEIDAIRSIASPVLLSELAEMETR